MPYCPELVSSIGRRNNQPLYMAFQGNRVGQKGAIRGVFFSLILNFFFPCKKPTIIIYNHYYTIK